MGIITIFYLGQLRGVESANMPSYHDNVLKTIKKALRIQWLREWQLWGSCTEVMCSTLKKASLTLAEVHFLYWKLGGEQIN